jgi:hypothetical protein
MAQGKNKLVSLAIGPLPVDTINRTLGLELDAGDVVLTAGVQKHVLRNHPEDFARCLPYVAAVVMNPLYVGDDFKNAGCIEVISRIPAIGSGLLVAVSIEYNDKGQYEIRSFYPVSDGKIQNRLTKGYLTRTQKR